MTQFAINLLTPPSYRREDYVVTECNRLAYDWVMQWPHWPAQALWLCGPAASGKTHLMHVWCERAHAAILSPQQLADDPEESFDFHPALALDGSWHALNETALFHLLNHAKQTGKWLLLVHSLAPAETDITLPDLTSRLKALPLVTLEQPDDLLLRAIMTKQLADRQLSIDPDIISYLLAHIERSCASVKEMVQLIDDAALQQKRRITLPFVRALLTKA